MTTCVTEHNELAMNIVHAFQSWISGCQVDMLCQWCREGVHPEHCTKLHMINCGKFDLHVDWELKSQPIPVTPPVPAGKAAKPKSASAKDAAALAAAAPIFLFEPKVKLLVTHKGCQHCQHALLHITSLHTT